MVDDNVAGTSSRLEARQRSIVEAGMAATTRANVANFTVLWKTRGKETRALVGATRDQPLGAIAPFVARGGRKGRRRPRDTGG